MEQETNWDSETSGELGQTPEGGVCRGPGAWCTPTSPRLCDDQTLGLLSRFLSCGLSFLVCKTG